MKLSFLCIFLVAKINGACIVLLLEGLVEGMGVNLSIAMGGRKFSRLKNIIFLKRSKCPSKTGLMFSLEAEVS